EPLTLQTRKDKAIDRTPNPTLVPYSRLLRSDWWRETPMRLPLGALLDPHPQRRDFLFSERLPVRIRGRHSSGRCVRRDALQNPGPGHAARYPPFRAVLGIQAQTRLAIRLIRTVARKAPVRKNRPHIAGKIDRCRGR